MKRVLDYNMGDDPPMSKRNRFKELDPSPDRAKTSKNKRPRPQDFVPLPSAAPNDDHIPRFLVASAVSKTNGIETKPLADFNTFQIAKGLDFISKDYIDVTEMRNGDLMIKTTNLQSAKKFLNAKYLDTIPVKITMHKNLNSVQGRIFSRKIKDISEEDLLEELKSVNVIEIRKITKRVENKFVPTGAAVVTFDLIRRPEKIKVGWERLDVDEHISNPMRCVICQRLGHTKNRCKYAAVCKECGHALPHEACIRKFCINCNNDSHTSFDPTCQTFLKHKSVNKIKADRRCTVREAWKVFNDNPEVHLIKPFKKNEKVPTYSEITRNSSTSQSNKNNTHKDTNKETNESLTKSVVTITKTATNLEAINNSSKTVKNYKTNLQKNNNNTNNSEKAINNEKEISNETETLSNNQNSSIIRDNTNSIIDSDNNVIDLATNVEPMEDDDLRTPPRPTTSVSNSPCSITFKKLPYLNTIITPNTFRKTYPEHKAKNSDSE